MSDQILVTNSQSVNPGRIIPLTQGYVAIVDDDDYDRINEYRWKILKAAKNHIYAVRNKLDPAVLGKRKSHAILMHREIVRAQKGQFVDHRDYNGLNNRRLNLRICTQSQNHGNRVITGGTSKFKGVYWNKEKQIWQAQIGCGQSKQGKTSVRFLGRYKKEVDAAIAYDCAAHEHFGEFALTNFPETYGSNAPGIDSEASMDDGLIKDLPRSSMAWPEREGP